MTITAKYAALKVRVGGNRELHHYEDTFGQPYEEQIGITAPNKMNKRILSEIEFSIALSAKLDGKYDAVIEEAIDYLTAGMNSDGVLTNSVCERAEEMLLPLSGDAKEYKLILVGHAHIDMNWMWSWHETVAATLATFRTMLRIMDEYPDFHFSQSQAAVYKIVEDYEPEMMEKIKARIAEGRWEITASAWVETDKNMPSTESLIKHIKYTKNYMRDVWGIDPDELEVDFSPDTFGHSGNLPELDTNGGVKYYYHCRALEGNQALYRWVSPSGKEMLCYREQHWYNSGITPKIGLSVFDISSRCAGFKTGLIVYGVGDHGGGPTRRDVENAIEMSGWPVFPTIKFGTMREFFHEAEGIREKLPVVDHEMNVIFTGCYTTQSRIKMGNRKCEAAFDDAEALSAFAFERTGRVCHTEKLEEAYRGVLFTHFHDILTGSCVQDSREHAMGLYSEALAYANNEYLGAMSAISEATDTSMIVTSTDPASQAEGAGPGYGVDRFNGKPASESGCGLTRIYTVFNPTPVDKDENVEITVWDWTGDMRYVKVTDEAGKPIEFQMLHSRPETYWDHKYFKLLVKLSVRALGYTTVVFSQDEIKGTYPVYINSYTGSSHPTENFVLDNGIIRAEFDYMSAALISLKDLETGREYIKEGARGSFVVIDTEKDSSNAWNIGKYLRVNPVDHVIKIRGRNGSLRNSFYFEASVLGSRIYADVILEKGAHNLSVITTVDWKEVGGESVPVLAYALPLSYTANSAMFDIPGGTLCRTLKDIDLPGLSFGAPLPEDGKAAVIVSDCKYGYRLRKDGTFISTLINTSTSPDSYPERGIHKFTVNIGIMSSDAKTLSDSATSICRKLTYISASSHPGTIPASGSLFTAGAGKLAISSVKVSDDKGALVIRACSLSDAEDKLELTFGRDIKEAFAVDYLDRPVVIPVSVNGNTVSAPLAKASIITLKISF